MKNRVAALLKQLNEGLFDKENVMALTFLSAVAGEGVFLLGPPGVAKSLVARRLKFAFASGSVFEYLMNRFSTPDELFGPVSIAKLKEQDAYERNVAGFLPTASIVFLDEIWKAGPAIQNALLTVLNEKIFRNGDKDVAVPLKALISASNGLPAKGEGLEALWDRFLVRVKVGGVENDDAFIEMIESASSGLEDAVDKNLKITESEYAAWNAAIDAIKLGDAARRVILHLRNEAIPERNRKEENENSPLCASDRRWKKTVRLLRASAFLNGRNAVDLADCFLLKHCLWDDDACAEEVSRMIRLAVCKQILPDASCCNELREELPSLLQTIMNETHTLTDTRSEEAKTVSEEYYALRKGDALLYMKKEAYDSLSAVPTTASLYKMKRLGSGYLSRNQAQIIREKLEGFAVSCDDKTIDLESAFVFDRSARLRTGSAPFCVAVDGEDFRVDTKTVGERRRHTAPATEARERVWDDKTQGYLDRIGEVRSGYDDFVRRGAQRLAGNLFACDADLEAMRIYAAEAKKECEELEMQILEIRHTYKKIKPGSILLH
jgi:MoxR-like ATPase